MPKHPNHNTGPWQVYAHMLIGAYIAGYYLQHPNGEYLREDWLLNRVNYDDLDRGPFGYTAPYLNICLRFETYEEAVAFAEKHGMPLNNVPQQEEVL